MYKKRRNLIGKNGRFPFSQNFRDFRFGGKWNTFRRFIPLENSQKKVENLKRWARFPGWNFRTECRVPFTFLVVHIPVPGPPSGIATYRGPLRPNGTTFYQSEIPLLLPPKFPGFFLNGKRPILTTCPPYKPQWVSLLQATIKSTSMNLSQVIADNSLVVSMTSSERTIINTYELQMGRSC